MVLTEASHWEHDVIRTLNQRQGAKTSYVKLVYNIY